MKPGTKLALGIAGGVLGGGILGYFAATSRIGRRVMLKISSEPRIRLPEPSYAVEVASTEEQLGILEDLVCECGKPIVQGASPQATIDEIAVQIQACIAAQLYPDFAWPPITGDHPSVSQLWNEIGYVARRALITAEICPRPLPSPYPTVPTPGGP